MQPPPPLDFVSTESVRQLYAAMPTVFARDIARAKGQSIPPQSMPTLKRDRPTEETELTMMKRHDTGESKAGTGMPLPATPALAPKSVPTSAQPFAGSVPQGAMLDRTRMVPMRQQQAQFQAQASQVQQPHVSGVRQMSPPQGTAGIGVGVGQPQVQSQQAGAHPNTVQHIINGFGPQGLSFMHQLQDPNSTFVKYMVEQIPNFLTLPLQQQLKSMQQTQVRFTTFMSMMSLWLTGMLPVANATTEADECTPTTPTTAAITAAAAAPTATATTTAAAAAAATPAASTTSTASNTSTTSATAATATQPTANTTAKYG
jgi:hypothetical protein